MVLFNVYGCDPYIILYIYKCSADFIAMFTSMFSISELPPEVYGAIWGIAVVIVLQLAWRSTQVRNQRTFELAPGTTLMVERLRLAEGLRVRVRRRK